jgi:NADPH-dependent curcumin reductase CurA
MCEPVGKRVLALLFEYRTVTVREGNEMPKTSNRQIILTARPSGIAKLSDFELVQKEMPSPKDGEVLLRNVLISVDPYQRNLMGNGSSELPPIDIGDPMQGPTVAVVEESKNADFAVGDHVASWSGWQEYAISHGTDLRKIDPDTAPLSTALGALGHTGLTAWVGSTKFLDPKPGGTFVVTAAAGSVGSVAAQLPAGPKRSRI